MKTEKKKYIAPDLTTVSFKVGHGFVNSVPLDALMLREQGDVEQMESNTEHDSWRESGGFW